VEWASSTPPQPGHKTFQVRSNSPIRDAWRKAGNHPLFVEPGALRKIQHVDTVKLVVFALIDQPSDGISDRGVGGLLQYRNLGLDLAHTERLDGSAGAAIQCLEPVRF